MNEDSLNPFAGREVAVARKMAALAEVEAQRAAQEVQAAIAVAKRFPRDQIAVVDRILNAFTRPSLADVAVYQYSRGGSDITGPSIRSAEAIAQLWGNMQFGIRELEQRDDESTVQAFAWDMETNTKREMTFQVPHTRYTKSGSKKLEDPRDIYEMVANQGARRLRACILSVIPGDVVEAAVKQAELTMKTKADTSAEAMTKMVEAFGGFGVTKEQIEKRIQRRLDAIQPAQVVSLKKVYASLRDGMSTAQDWFEDAEPSVAERAAAAKDKARQETSAGAADPKPAAKPSGRAKAAPTPESAPAAKSAPAPASAPEAKDSAPAAAKQEQQPDPAPKAEVGKMKGAGERQWSEQAKKYMDQIQKAGDQFVREMAVSEAYDVLELEGEAKALEAWMKSLDPVG